MTQTDSRNLRRGWVLAGCSFALIAALTLVPQPEQAQLSARTPITCLVCGTYGTVDVLLNILLFVPLGFGLRLAGVPWRRALGLAALATLTIEALQLRLVTGRDASLSDPITNTVGAAVGIKLAGSLPDWVSPARSRSAHLAFVGSALWVALWIATAWLLTPSLPRTDYWGQWAPDLAHLERFEGRLLWAVLEDETLARGRVSESALLREDLLDGDVRVTASGIMGGPTAGLAPIASVFDENEQEILLLGQDGDDLVFRVRLRASDLRLRNPAVRLPGALADAQGDTLLLGAAFDGQRIALSAEGTGRALESRAAPSPSWGWGLVLPFDHHFGGEHQFLTALWIAGFLAPLAYWAVRSGRRSCQATVLGSVVLALGAAPSLFGLAPVHWSEWAAAAAGIAAGALLGRRTLHGRPAEATHGGVPTYFGG